MVGPPLSSRLLMGAIAGFCATLPMTMAMRALHRRLPPEERYPAPPRELIDAAAAAMGVSPPEVAVRDLTLLTHHAYGAAAGALIAAALPRPRLAEGAAAGVAVWIGSYLGWIPAANMLQPATDHPARRNRMMIAAHLVWGAATALALRQLGADRDTLLAQGIDKDRSG